jgi:hypothetical protein
MPPSAPDCETNGGIRIRIPALPTSWARNPPSSAPAAVEQRRERDHAGHLDDDASHVATARTHGDPHGRDGGDDARARRQPRHQLDVDEQAREEQCGQRGGVTQGGHQRRADGVEVPSPADRQHGEADRDGQDHDRAEHPADDGDHEELGDRDRRLAERRRRQLGEHREPHRRRQRRHDRDGHVVTERAPTLEGGVEQAGVDAGAQAGRERAEDRPSHPDGRRDQDEQPRESLERPADVAERQSGDEARDRAEGERDRALAERAAL